MSQQFSARLAPHIRQFQRRVRRRLQVVRRELGAIRSNQIAATLAQLQPSDRAVLVHSSLSACGYISGGAPAVLAALHRWAGDRTLALPTHTYCYPRENGETPVFDVHTTRSVVGAITNCFLSNPDVLRSVHPSHSLAVRGPGGSALIHGHDRCETPCGPGTPYERLVEQDASVLMFGCGMEAYTLFHTAEDAAGVPYLYWPEPVAMRLLDRDGGIRSMRMWRQDMRVERRFAETVHWAEENGLLRRIRLGCGELLFIPHAARMHERLLEQLRRDPFFLVTDEAREQLT